MTPRSRSLSAKLHYAFDTLMARGWLAQIGLVLSMYAALVLLAAAGLVLADIHPADNLRITLEESAWVSLMHALNSGVIARAQGWPFRGLMLFITLAGLFTTVTLTGIVTSAIGRKLLELQRGRSVVLEEGHTLILGWSPSTFTILDELVKANAHRRRHCIVILAERDQVVMEEALRRHDGEAGATRIICRTGRPFRSEDLAIVNPAAAKSIIVLSPPPAPGLDPDVQVIRTLLSLLEAPDRKAGKYHVVAEIREPAKLDVARLVGGDEIELIAPARVISHLIVQTSLQPGLSSVYRALFRYEGSEIYFRTESKAVGLTFRETLGLYENASVLGLRHVDGSFTLLPALNYRVQPGERLIALAETSESFQLRSTEAAHIDRDAIHGLPLPVATPRRILILGWSVMGPAIVRELDRYLLSGSEVCVVARDEAKLAEIIALRPALENLTLQARLGDPTDRVTLEGLSIPAFDHLILLSPIDTLRAEEADARTLVALVQIRAIMAAQASAVTIASEIHDDTQGGLTGLARADDFVVSDTLISMMLAQVAENKDLNAVFADLLNAQGAELALRPVSHYMVPGRAVYFETVVAAVMGHGEVVLGFRRARVALGHYQGVVLNPARTARITFEPDDQLIVLTRSRLECTPVNAQG